MPNRPNKFNSSLPRSPDGTSIRRPSTDAVPVQPTVVTALIPNNSTCGTDEKSAATLFKETLDNQRKRLKETQVRLAESERINGELAHKMTETSARNALLVADKETLKREKEEALFTYVEEIRKMNALLGEERLKAISTKKQKDQLVETLEQEKSKMTAMEKEKEDLLQLVAKNNGVVEGLQRSKTDLENQLKTEKKETTVERQKRENIQCALDEQINQRKAEKLKLEERIADLESQLDDLLTSMRTFGELFGSAVARSRLPHLLPALSEAYNRESQLMIPDSSHSTTTSSHSKADENGDHSDCKRRRVK